jgi:hypothetical protein
MDARMDGTPEATTSLASERAPRDDAGSSRDGPCWHDAAGNPEWAGRRRLQRQDHGSGTRTVTSAKSAANHFMLR